MSILSPETTLLPRKNLENVKPSAKIKKIKAPKKIFV